MRNISFALTTAQIRNRSKRVTRRLGWTFLKGGETLRPVKKCMGFRPGEKVEQIAEPIRVVSARRERLDRMITDPDYGRREAALEGFPGMTGAEFVAFLCEKNHGCSSSSTVTRIEFDYIEAM